MTVRVPNGSIIAIASGYSAVIAMSALTNDNPALATLAAAHGVTAGAYLEVTSGWSRLNGKIAKAGTVATNDVPLLKINTELESIYPPGTGIGSVRRVTGWTQIQQVLTPSSSGGEQQFLTYQFLEDDQQKQIPTYKNPNAFSFAVADDDSLPGFQLASEANDDRLPRAVRITLPSGSELLYNAYISVNKTPSLTVNELMACQVSLALLAEPTRY